MTHYNQALAHRLSLHNLAECEHFPKYFEIETVNACNARCIMCTINDWDKKQNSIMPMPLFERYVEEVSHYADWIECICLNRDGEPTLDKQLPLRVKMLKQAGIKKVTFVTNAQLLGEKMVLQLLEAGLDDIMISIDGVTKATFEKIRVRLQFEVVVNNTLRLIALRNTQQHPLNIRVRMVVMDDNRHELDAFLAFWKNQLKATDDIYARDMHSWGNQFTPENQTKIDFMADKPCISPFSTLVMHVDGTVPLCGADYNAKIPLGDFSKTSLKAIWNSQAYQTIRQSHAEQRRNDIWMCRGCDIWERETQGRKSETAADKKLNSSRQ